MSWRACLTGLLVALCLAGQLGLAVHAQAQPDQGQEEPARPEVQVIQPQLITFGSLRIYLLSFPYSPPGAPIEYPSSVSISVAVWGASVQNPVLVWIDGREVARITEDGVFTIMMELPEGCHHAAVLCAYGIIASSSFYVRPPPPPGRPEGIPLADVQRMLEELRREVWRNCLIAACVGVVIGYGLKRASKIEFYQLYMLPAIPMAVGLMPWAFPTLYWLVPLGLTAMLAYHFVPDFAEKNKLVELVSPWAIRTKEIPTYEGEYIVGLMGLREALSSRRLIRTKPIRLVGAYPIDFDGITAYIVRRVEETEDEFVVECDDALARAFVDAEALRKTSDRMAELELQNRMFKAALPMCIFLTLQSVENRIRRLRHRPELIRQVEQIAHEVYMQLSQRLGISPEVLPETAQGVGEP